MRPGPIAIRSSDRAEEMEPRPYSGTLLTAALASGGTIQVGGESRRSNRRRVSPSPGFERHCAAASIRPTGTCAFAIYADCRKGIADGELVAWFDAISELCAVSLRSAARSSSGDGDGRRCLPR